VGNCGENRLRIGVNIRSFFRQLDDVSIEECLYRVSLILIPGMAFLGVLIYLIAHITGLNEMTACFMKQAFGLPCPGCGGTRAVWALMHGQLLKAIYYHAFAAYSIVLYVLFFITHTLHKVTNGKIRGMKYRNGYVVMALLLLVGQYILKLCVKGYEL